ncbi:hypothetical protein QBC37DRAFT_198966 [Rhypophila decipiens]|uniref:Uncharacterized protein n=1 Tax=Rhypophila decipiens TaxID=261697 RepID=A0AAN6YKJ3_9PEZI|nr:hypothetical protein QBC37DRAFT_198966 [Rhypophila decipiens]
MDLSECLPVEFFHPENSICKVKETAWFSSRSTLQLLIKTGADVCAHCRQKKASRVILTRTNKRKKDKEPEAGNGGRCVPVRRHDLQTSTSSLFILTFASVVILLDRHITCSERRRSKDLLVLQATLLHIECLRFENYSSSHEENGSSSFSLQTTLLSPHAQSVHFIYFTPLLSPICHRQASLIPGTESCSPTETKNSVRRLASQ